MQTAGGSGPIDLTGNYTVAAWFKTSNTTDTMDIVGAHNKAGTTFGLLAEVKTNDKLRWLHRPFGSGGVNLESSSDVNDGVWHHFAAVFDGTDVRLFVDGIEKDSAPVAPLETDGDDVAVTVGQLSNDPMRNERHFEGNIDEVRIYGVAL